MTKQTPGKLFLITQESDFWQTFVKMSCNYILKTWPEKLDGKDPTQFQNCYETLLKKRLAEGGRGLFLFKIDEKIVGLGNVYIKNKQLHIAEFYIVEDERKKGLGTKFFNLLKAWGKQLGATSVSIEVDKHLTDANKFWEAPATNAGLF